MARQRYKQTVAPTEDPLGIEEVKVHLRIDDSEENELIRSLIKAATGWAQDYCWSQFVTATWQVKQDDFFCTKIPLHPNPVSAVTALSYVDSGGSTQTLSENTDWVSDLNSWPNVIYPAYDKQWPTTRGYENDVTITVTAGYGAQSAVPVAIKQALLLLVANWYEHRTAAGCDMGEIPFGVKPLLDNYSYRVLV